MYNCAASLWHRKQIILTVMNFGITFSVLFPEPGFQTASGQKIPAPQHCMYRSSQIAVPIALLTFITAKFGRFFANSLRATTTPRCRS